MKKSDHRKYPENIINDCDKPLERVNIFKYLVVTLTNGKIVGTRVRRKSLC